MDKLLAIYAERREAVAVARQLHPLAELEQQIAVSKPPRGFAAALSAKQVSGYAIIAEMKRASPSAGLIRPHYDPADLARAYHAGGAACLSVLTEPNHFQGDLTHLHLARCACPLPLLRKDFLVDVYQVAEARAHGADAILIILASTPLSLAHELYSAAQYYGLDVLVETHNAAELEQALTFPAAIIGINNRNLRTLKTDIALSTQLAPLLPAGRLGVAESGLKSRIELDAIAAHGIRSFLIGESILKQDDCTAALNALQPASRD